MPVATVAVAVVAIHATVTAVIVAGVTGTADGATTAAVGVAAI